MKRTEETTVGGPVAPWPTQIAIIGGGTMGLGIAEQFALAGRRVRITDATPELARVARERLRARVAGHVAAGLLPEDAIARIETVEAADDIPAAVAGAEFILEAVPEERGAKAAVFDLCSEYAAPGTVIASNTSSFPIDSLAAFVDEPSRFLGTHWFNPPEWTPGVEVIPHPGTAPDVVARVMAFLREVGKEPVVVGNGPGFVANRIQNALFLEAVRCVEEGLASPQEVDAIVRSSFGFRLPFFGPFQIADMAGLDTYARVLETLQQELGERFFVPDMLREQVARGRVGTKGGAGFADYTEEQRDQLLLDRDRYYAALAALLQRESVATSTGGKSTSQS
jgi:3-hydroxybutyryl-CoA dehydrogenase